MTKVCLPPRAKARGFTLASESFLEETTAEAGDTPIADLLETLNVELTGLNTQLGQETDTFLAELDKLLQGPENLLTPEQELIERLIGQPNATETLNVLTKANIPTEERYKNTLEALLQGYSPDEAAQAEKFSRAILTEAEKVPAEQASSTLLAAQQASGEGQQRLFEKLKDKDDEVVETIRLMIRIGVKVSVKAVKIIADNIKKNPDAAPEFKFLAGVVSDVARESGGFLDSAIAGRPKADLEKDVIAWFNGGSGNEKA